jgi:hypothetical protein
MEIIQQPWKTTTDPKLQREGTWYIFPKDIPKDQQNAKSHVGEFQRAYPDCEILTLAGFGDLTMNLWHVGFVHNCITKSPCLLHLRDEPMGSRIYTCLVKWKNKTYSINPVRFNPFIYNENKKDPRVVIIDDKPVAHKIEFAIFGQQVVRDGTVIDARQMVHQFSDIRHLLAVVNLNPSNGRPRIFFGAQRYDDVWFGEAQLLDDRNLRRAALSGPIEINRLYKGLGCPKEILENFLLEYGCNQTETPYKILQPGEWRWILEDDNLVEIYFRRSVYPCTMLGVTADGNLLSLAWTGKYNVDGGWTIEQAAKSIAKQGAKDAILCDEGQDVMQLGLKLNEGFDIPNKRKQVRATLIFAKDKSKVAV